ncbi:hypothetical protein C3B58_01935 [Lactonifactor longoviformis]|uniref:SurA N-terminal domain-containing protein n=1 Tax=Lactonifactor longoviformis DSM 17459 TaxID=1122155 RepID=A0A1M5C9B7_9CLOT|nr:hypothetical protein [Lactonifactor longoviformis]POP34615.1 hypothetical protein C3B58_01935 [Lactonifactor longoviformis]SHF51343.1 hypothetical protein SAMN02745158_04030 [Lactonifactor longoviformis DSM 17459]
MKEIKKKQLWLILAVCCFLAVIIVSCIYIRGKNTTAQGTALTVNGYSVAEEEFQMILSDYRSKVYSLYSSDEIHKESFWITEYDGETPLKKIEGLAVEHLVRNKTIQKLSEKRGLTKKFSYSDIIEETKKENAERKQAYDSGQAVYGMRSYEIDDYYKYLYSNMEAALIVDLIKNTIEVTEEECKTYYEEHKEMDAELQEGYEKTKSIIKRRIQDDKADAIIAKEIKKAKVNYDQKQLDRLALEVLTVQE